MFCQLRKKNATRAVSALAYAAANWPQIMKSKHVFVCLFWFRRLTSLNDYSLFRSVEFLTGFSFSVDGGLEFVSLCYK